MRLLANENVPGLLVQELRVRGHDVKWILEVSPGATDTAVLEMAQRERRIALTFDKDFGELAWRKGTPAAAGVIVLRLSAPSPELVTAAAVRSIESRSDWEGHFSVITADRVRTGRPSASR
jgi:predicted nuclease of predicted toxin-antitoxin system